MSTPTSPGVTRTANVVTGAGVAGLIGIIIAAIHGNTISLPEAVAAFPAAGAVFAGIRARVDHFADILEHDKDLAIAKVPDLEVLEARVEAGEKDLATRDADVNHILLEVAPGLATKMADAQAAMGKTVADAVAEVKAHAEETEKTLEAKVAAAEKAADLDPAVVDEAIKRWFTSRASEPAVPAAPVVPVIEHAFAPNDNPLPA